MIVPSDFQEHRVITLGCTQMSHGRLWSHLDFRCHPNSAHSVRFAQAFWRCRSQLTHRLAVGIFDGIAMAIAIATSGTVETKKSHAVAIWQGEWSHNCTCGMIPLNFRAAWFDDPLTTRNNSREVFGHLLATDHSPDVRAQRWKGTIATSSPQTVQK